MDRVNPILDGRAEDLNGDALGVFDLAGAIQGDIGAGPAAK